MLRALFGSDSGGRTLVGIGDDAAVVLPSGQALVWTIDAQVQDVHFARDLMTMVDLGYRATMAAASDLAAMGASPLGILSALVLPDDLGDEALLAIAEGQREAAAVLGTSVLGGNMTRGSELSITTTVLGESRRPIGRAGAVPGQTVAIAGLVGLSAAGLLLLQRGLGANDEAAPAVHAFRRPLARIREGLSARDVATAAIDISDGLARDLGHVARASNVRVQLEASALVTEALARAAALLSMDPYHLALHGGEDYAVVVTVPEGEVPEGFVPIGQVLRAEPNAKAISMRSAEGSITPVEERGFDHFSSNH